MAFLRIPSVYGAARALRSGPRAALVLGLALAWTAPVAGQGTNQSGAQEAATCQRIGRIDIRNNSLFSPEEIQNKKFSWALGAVNRVHIRTRSDYVRKALLLEQGGCFDDAALAASVRNVRDLDFIARAEATSWRQQDSTLAIRFETWDEWSTTANVDFDVENSFQFKGFLLAESNLLGRGLKASFRSRTFREQRNNNFTLATTRLFGTRSQASIAGGTTRIGEFWRQDVWRNYQTESADFFYTSRLQYENREVAYLTGDLKGLTHVLLPLTDKFWNAKYERRTGVQGDLFVFGAEVDVLRRTTDSVPLQVLKRDFADAIPAHDSLVAELRSQSSPDSWVRVGGEIGVRNIRFTTARGLDLIAGQQTVSHGGELLLTVGRTLGTWGTSSTDTYAQLDGFLLGQRGPVLANASFSAEGRMLDYKTLRESRYRDLLFRGRALLYVQPPALPQTTLQTGVRFNLRDNVDQPYQVALGGEDGVRGYNEEDLPTSTTFVAFQEARVNLPFFRPAVGLGLTGFFDVGRGWAADVPFGQDTGWRTAAGGGIRIAFPAGSGTVTRLEIAWPLGSAAGDRGPVIRTYWSPVTTRR